MRTLVVFLRAPELGKVKTRLAATIGDDRALALYRAFLDDCIAVADAAAQACGARVILAVAGQWQHGAHEHVAQPAGDLGAKIGFFIDRYVDDGPVCVIGSDAPALRPEQIVRAFDELAAHEVVLGPSMDGGYWLLGTRRAIPELLDAMPWSTSRVLDETLRRLNGRSVQLIDVCYDVDDADDLARLRDDLAQLPTDIAPATRAVLPS